MNNTKSRQVVLSGLMVALVFVATYTIRIPVPFTNGYIHAGDSMIFLAALFLGPVYGAIAGGIGSAMADILGGYAHFALPTLVIKSIMGFLVGFAAKQLAVDSKKLWRVIFPLGAGAVWFSFIFMMKKTLQEQVASHPEMLQQTLGSENLEGAIEQASTVASQLTGVAVVVPLLLFVMTILLNKVKGTKLQMGQVIAMALAGIWMVSGYYVVEIIMTGSVLLPLFSLPWNVVQFVLGLIIAYVIYIGLAKSLRKA